MNPQPKLPSYKETLFKLKRVKKQYRNEAESTKSMMILISVFEMVNQGKPSSRHCTTLTL
jgi:hypothetical protein